MERLKRIKLLAMDVDGVLTDGSMILGSKGEVKVFDAHDGLGITLALESGLEIAWITGNNSESVAKRAEALGVTNLFLGARYKSVAIGEIARQKGLKLTEIAYIGDDLNDLPALEAVGAAFAVANASAEAKAAADFVTDKSGGHGAVREAIEMILKAQGRWEEGVQLFLARLQREQESGQAPG
jgi:3-deoxy-D-manno-octulosonate 8-phosphate phosphatase (KDO 8-P phosphatase)